MKQAVIKTSYDLTSPGSPEHLLGAGISSSFLDTLDVKLPFGRDSERVPLRMSPSATFAFTCELPVASNWTCVVSGQATKNDSP
jgi:hypothetical protein